MVFELVDLLAVASVAQLAASMAALWVNFADTKLAAHLVWT